MAGVRRILFVDDEPSILESLRDALRPWRREWQATFACGGEAALEHLSADTFDVVVSDMRMPGIDGVALLRRVQEIQPQAVRIVLSGSTETDVLAKAAAVAHRFLAKPCDVEELARVMSATTTLGETSRGQPLLQTISGATSLPCAPELYRELSALLADDTASTIAVARVIEKDIAVTGKLLQLTNSTFLGVPRVVGRVDEAVDLLGLSIVKAIVLSAHALAAYRPARPIDGFSIESLERNATRVAALARRLLPDGAEQEEACAAAMLHEIGWLVIAAEDPDRVAALLATAREQRRPVAAVERERGEPTHADLGAHLLALWGLPETIVSAVACHHLPAPPREPRLDVAGAVHVAAALIAERCSAVEWTSTQQDRDWLTANGSAGRIEAWRALAEAVA
jgi:HD-like signal output (HDOD) protein/ActR/RegA family two-component response regulator